PFSVKVAAQAPATGSPSGIVTFFDGTTAIGSGTISGGSAAFAETTQLAAGSHSITASYAGDGNFNGSSNSSGFSVTVSQDGTADRKSTRLNSSHRTISYAVFCLKKKTNIMTNRDIAHTL